MKKKELLLENVKLEVASEILAIKISLAINSNNQDEIYILLNEQNKIYNYDENIITKIINVYGCEIKKILKGEIC